MKNQKGFSSSKKQDWETPIELFKQLDDEFHFTLDVCATSENTKCERFLSPEDNGLALSWGNNVCWMNPPYGHGQQDKWIRKAYEESNKSATVVCLISARTDTKRWHDYIFPYAEVRFIKGRVVFVGAEHGAFFPSAIAIFGECAEVGKIKIFNQ